jgi:hypothetical protein
MAEIGRAGYGSNQLWSPDRSILVVDGLQWQYRIHGYAFRQHGVGAQPDIQRAIQAQAVQQERKPALVTKISSFKNCSFERSKVGCTILDSDRGERGEIQYDVKTHERLDSERCVVLGRDALEPSPRRTNYYILVVRPTGKENRYTRVGTGRIQRDYVARQDLQALIV